MELRDTIKLMESNDFKDRFKAEYHQLVIRIGKLAGILSAWDVGELGFQPKCSYGQLESQLCAMKIYAHILEKRAELEGIDLTEGV